MVMINYGLSPEAWDRLQKREVGVLVQNRVDLDVQNQSGEDWVIVFDTSIIKKWEKINPSKMVLGDYDLPRMI